MNFTNQTLKSACNYFKKELEDLFDSSELDQTLQISLHHFFGWNRADIVLNQNEILSEENIEQIVDLITQLKTKKPLAQIIGEWEFYGLNFKVNEHTLIPRPETEELIQLIVEGNKESEGISVLDVGTGSGCIAISLKEQLNSAKVSAFDISKEALEVASKNASENNLEVFFKEVDILDWRNYNLSDKYNVIVSNPPYIPEKEKKLMQTNVLDYEPGLALFVDNTEPLIFYDKISDFALRYLKPEGKLYFEINENFGEETKQLLIDKKFKNVNIVKDLNDKDRIVCCTLN